MSNKNNGHNHKSYEFFIDSTLECLKRAGLARKKLEQFGPESLTEEEKYLLQLKGAARRNYDF